MPESSARVRVLVVDDERIIADTLALILKQNGFDAVAAYNGETGIEAATLFKPDVLITDVIMGKMSGIEVAIRTLGFLPRCRVILLSGNARTATLLHHADIEGHHFEIITKPAHPNELLRLLAETRF